MDVPVPEAYAIQPKKKEILNYKSIIQEKCYTSGNFGKNHFAKSLNTGQVWAPPVL